MYCHIGSQRGGVPMQVGVGRKNHAVKEAREGHGLAEWRYDLTPGAQIIKSMVF